MRCLTLDLSSDTKSKGMRVLMLLVQATISILFLLFLFSTVNLEKTMQVLSTVNLPLLLISSSLFISSSLAIGFALHYSLQSTGTNPPLATSILASFGGQLLSDVTPAKAGYFSTPLLLYEMKEIPIEKGLMGVMSMGAVNFFVKAAFSTTGLIYFLNIFTMEANMVNALLVGIVLLLIGGVGLTVMVCTDLLSTFLLKLSKLPLIGGLAQKLDSLRRLFRKDQNALKKSATTTALSVLASVLIFTLALFLLSRSVGLTRPSFQDLLFMGPLTAVFMYVPLTFAGLGIQEAAYVFLLTRLGSPFEPALTFALLVRLLFVSTDLIGLPSILKTGTGILDSLHPPSPPSKKTG